MAQITWITPKGSLGSIAEEEYFEFNLEAIDSSGSASPSISYSLISGSLGSGLQITSTGLIQGIPTIQNPQALENVTETFTIRAKNSQGYVADRTFNIDINLTSLPQILPRNISLGSYYDGSFINIALTAANPSPLSTLVWSVSNGTLPLGLSLTPTGVISGYIAPNITTVTTAELGWGVSAAPWDYVPFDIQSTSIQPAMHRFTIQVFDGINYDESNYNLTVLPKVLLTTDSTTISIDSSTLYADSNNLDVPFMITPANALPITRQGNYFNFQFQGTYYDVLKTNLPVYYEIVYLTGSSFDQGPDAENPFEPIQTFDQGPDTIDPTISPIYFDQQSTTQQLGLVLDKKTGWLRGTVEPQGQAAISQTYKFEVFCYTYDTVNNKPLNFSIPITYSLTVLGNLSNMVTWTTPSNLGTIVNGATSEFAVNATTPSGKVLNYRFKEGDKYPADSDPSKIVIIYTPNTISRLPQGLSLLPNGLISGRVSFEYFNLDHSTVTFDKNATTFDNTYTFTVTASDETATTAATISADQTFTIKVNNYNKTPYENLYLKALPDVDKRLQFTSLIDNTSIFPSELIYRSNDPWFGKATDIKFLFAAGLTPTLAATYASAMATNHYRKTVNLGQVKTAVVLDLNFNIKYEVVYVEVIDPETVQGNSPSQTISRTTQIIDQYNNMPFSTVYPNSYDNMRTAISSVGYANKGALPKWMLDPQSTGRVLGFTQGVVLAYTVPGASQLIAYRLQQSGISFNNLDFIVDRYQLDQNLSKNWDMSTNSFIPSVETTFDKINPPISMVHGAYINQGAVDFAITVPFDQINGRTVSYITSTSGLLDGISTAMLQTGKLIVFAKDSNYAAPYNNEVNDGWNQVISNTETLIVPGFAEYLQTGVINQRAGIWQIHITASNVVTLQFYSSLPINGYIQVNTGQSYAESRLYYSNTGKLLTLPTTINTAINTTRFDGGSTKFYNDQDVYAVPETGDIYIGFPRENIYN